MEFPDFDFLPKVNGQPQGNAWALWGEGDEVGSLNYLTPSVVKAAAQEVQAGISIQLDLRLDFFDHLTAGRESLKHDVIDFKERGKGTPFEIVGHDDVLSFNTQCSSQWDGFRHIGIQETGTYYQGMQHRDIDDKPEDGRLGIHKWAERGGIVARGVLLDYHLWRQQTHQNPINAATSHAITTAELDAVAKHQGTDFRTGDILLIRTGFTSWYLATPSHERIPVLDKGAFVGVEASMDSVRWLWNHHFAAVAADTMGFEVCPVGFHTRGAVRLHEWLLCHWGTPIGELWDLERLAEVCKGLKRWSFMLTSAPLNVFGGVASPPNVIAIL